MHARVSAPGHRRIIAVLVCLSTWLAAPALAQPNVTDRTRVPEPGTSAQADRESGRTAAGPDLREAIRRAAVFAPTQDPPPDRACDGCPWRRPGHAFLQATWINVAYGLGNLARGEETAKVTPGTWWANMKAGWEWDLNDFVVNQIGHPYQGNNYFTAGRGNGLSFWESAAVAAFGSATWEYFGETNRPSLNDFINTTLGGIALGEMFHRTAWLVRDTHATGGGRLAREIAATAIDPLTGLNRFLSGDASRMTEKPADLVPGDLGGLASAGALWRGSNTRAVDSAGAPFLEMDLLYGNIYTGRSRTPYDAFLVRFRVGGGSPVSEVQVRGRLLGRPLRNGGVRFGVLQSYDFNKNDVFEIGAQSFEATLLARPRLSARTSVLLVGWSGVTVLGAVDSPPEVAAYAASASPAGTPEEEPVGPRTYDYGPGWNFGGNASFFRDNWPFAIVSYEARHLWVLDGTRANHLLQRVRVDLMAPLRGPLGLGVSGEYFDRQTFYKDAAGTARRTYYPQIRAYLTWRLS